MLNDPNKSNALRNTLLGFVTSVILILVGYWLNNWLSRDNLSIEYVRFVPETEGPLPSPEMRHKLHELSVNPHFQRLGTSDPFSPTCQLNPSNNGEEHPGFAKGVTKYLKGCVVTFQDSIRQDLDDLKKAKADLDRPADSTDVDAVVTTIQTRLLPGAMEQINREAGQKKALAAKQQVIRATESAVQGDQAAGEVLEYLKDYKTTRTGRLLIIATVMNSGDTDGLIMPSSGENRENLLIMNENSGRLPMKLLGARSDSLFLVRGLSAGSPQSDSAVSVARRSAVTITFALDPAVIPSSTWGTITDHIKQKSDLRGQIILKDMRNRDLTSKEFNVPTTSQDE